MARKTSDLDLVCFIYTRNHQVCRIIWSQNVGVWGKCGLGPKTGVHGCEINLVHGFGVHGFGVSGVRVLSGVGSGRGLQDGKFKGDVH